MSPIPGEPLKRKDLELTTKDGRKVKVNIPGMSPLAEPLGTEQRQPPEPPRDNPGPRVNPNTTGG